MADILDSMNLSSNIRDALENRGGTLGRLLLWVERFERQDKNAFLPYELSHLGDEDIAMSIVESYRWTTQWISHIAPSDG